MHFNEAFDPFRALKCSWQVVKRAPLIALVASPLLGISTALYVSGGVNTEGQFSGDLSNLDNVVTVLREQVTALVVGIGLAVLAIGCVMRIVGLFFRAWLQIGLVRVSEVHLAGNEPQLPHLFETRHWIVMVLTQVACSLLVFAATLPGVALAGLFGLLLHALDARDEVVMIGTATTACLYLPVVAYVWLGLRLAPLAVAVEGMRVGEAISRSWALVKGRRLAFFVYELLFGLIAYFPCCFCCLLGFPLLLTELARIDSYMRLVREGEPSTWFAKPGGDASTSAGEAPSAA